jgi:protein TonB
MSHTEIARFLPLPPALRTALVLSIVLHAVVVAWARPGRIELPRPLAVEHLQVSLAAAPAVRMARAPKATPTPATERTRSAPADEVGAAERASADRDEPLVEAKFHADALHNPKPPYPLAARRQGIEGRVLLAAHVRADGACGGVTLKQSSGHALLDDAALTTVRRWRFLPARRGNAAVDSWVEIPISFRLEG